MNNIEPPSAKPPKLTRFLASLSHKRRSNKQKPKYSHLFIWRKKELGSGISGELYKYVNNAHEGARRELRVDLGDSLHPIHHNTRDDPALGYPFKLPESMLKGYFGEILTGVVAEHYVGDDEFNWEVPVFLFRTHLFAFQQLDLQNQTEEDVETLVGRQGNDLIAFSRDENGQIIACLDCEAKFSSQYNLNKIKQNIEKLKKAPLRPVDFLNIKKALGDYRNDEYRQRWEEAITDYWFRIQKQSPVSRSNLSFYVYGKRSNINPESVLRDSPPMEYTSKRNLICAELYIPNVSTVVKNIYAQMDIDQTNT